MKPATKEKIIAACRIVVAVVFIFSGLSKIIDPYGTALKTAEYLSAMGLDFARPAAELLAVVQITFELTLGIVLLTRILRRLATFAAFAAMLFFTLLTLWLAVWNPIEDCGCFGQIVVLTNWQTFFKNLIILPLSLVAWRAGRSERLLPRVATWWVVTAVIAAVVALVALWNLTMLPPVDLTPFKKGTDLRLAEPTRPADGATQIVCRNRLSGELSRFDPADSVWWNESEWEFVETLTDGRSGHSVEVTKADFAIFDGATNVTDSLLAPSDTLQIVCAVSLDRLPQHERQRLGEWAAEKLSAANRVICLTASPLSSDDPFAEFGETTIRCYNADITLLQVLLRADFGVVSIVDGRITDKRSVAGL